MIYVIVYSWKGRYVVSQNWNIYSVNKVLIQTHKYVFFFSVNVHYFKLERWQGPPHINKEKQYKSWLSLII